MASLDLTLPVTYYADGETHTSTFADLLDGPTVVSVYMSNNTGSCDRQMIALADAAWDIEGAGVAVVGLSKNSPTSHARYAHKHSIGFPLISDVDHAFSKAVGGMVMKKMRGKEYEGPARAVYIVGADGTVHASEAVDTKAHGKQVLRMVRELTEEA
ncbi:MAG: redoxin domain-containing protein [Bacteroidota bacterium]